MPQTYEQLLARAMELAPKRTGTGERFELPRATVMKAGLKTIIPNFYEIADRLRRDPDHLLKFLLKELATKTDQVKPQLIVFGNFSEDHITRKLEIYVKQYLICKECGRPDTKILREDSLFFLKCEACGAKHAAGKAF